MRAGEGNSEETRKAAGYNGAGLTTKPKEAADFGQWERSMWMYTAEAQDFKSDEIKSRPDQEGYDL